MMVILLPLYRKPLDRTPFPGESVSTHIEFLDFSVNKMQLKTNYIERISISTRKKKNAS